jgi:hypothetical protein
VTSPARPRLDVTAIGRRSARERDDAANILEKGTDRSVSSRKPEVRWLDVPTIAASLMAILNERRAAHARTEKRPPTPAELEAIQTDVISEWAALTAQLQRQVRSWSPRLPDR